jgi:regulator of protease activity HflC (stomatin/prohibitin superfamily)
MKFVCAVEEYDSAINKLCRTYVREVISTASVNEILHNRRAFSAHILENVQTYAYEWGIEIISVRLDEIKFDQAMARALARSAEAEREKQATLIHAEAQQESAVKLAEAADILNADPEKSWMVLRLKELNVLSGIAKEKTNTTIVAFPMGVSHEIQKIFSKKPSPSNITFDSSPFEEELEESNRNN